jgi:hypothetical protein
MSVLTGCSSGSESGTPPGSAAGTTTSSAAPTTTSTTSSGSSTSAPTTAATTSVAPTSAGPTTAVEDECTAEALDVTVTSGGSAAGTSYSTIIFTNRSPSRCVMQGFPGVSFLDAGGTQIGLAAGRDTVAPVVAVPLGPGASAHARLGVSETGFQGTPACGPTVAATTVRIYAPDSTTAVDLPAAGQMCTGAVAQVNVQAVAAGASAP